MRCASVLVVLASYAAAAGINSDSAIIAGEGQLVRALVHESKGVDECAIPRLSHPDGERLRPPKFSHSVQDVARNSGLDNLPSRIASAKASAEDRLVSKEGVLDARLMVIASFFLPASPPHRSDSCDRTVAR